MNFTPWILLSGFLQVGENVISDISRQGLEIRAIDVDLMNISSPLGIFPWAVVRRIIGILIVRLVLQWAIDIVVGGCNRWQFENVVSALLLRRCTSVACGFRAAKCVSYCRVFYQVGEQVILHDLRLASGNRFLLPAGCLWVYNKTVEWKQYIMKLLFFPLPASHTFFLITNYVRTYVPQCNCINSADKNQLYMRIHLFCLAAEDTCYN